RHGTPHSASRLLFLSLGAQRFFLCGGHGTGQMPPWLGLPGLPAGRPHGLFPAVSVCPLPHRRFIWGQSGDSLRPAGVLAVPAVRGAYAGKARPEKGPLTQKAAGTQRTASRPKAVLLIYASTWGW